MGSGYMCEGKYNIATQRDNLTRKSFEAFEPSADRMITFTTVQFHGNHCVIVYVTSDYILCTVF
jgi:hypothetical protein